MSRDRLRDEYESNQDALGVTEERQEFFDDANSVLGIGYSATMEAGRSKRILREIDERDDEAATALKKKLEVDPGAGETVNRGAADDYAALRNAGYDHETAMAMTANNEYEVQGDHSEYEPDGDRVTPSMLQRENRVHGGGGGKSKSPRKPAKPIVGKCHNCEANLTADLAVCQGCGSEVVIRRGRRDEGGRSSFVGAKVSDSVRDALTSGSIGVTAGEIVQAVVSVALNASFGPGQVRAMLDELMEKYSAGDAA